MMELSSYDRMSLSELLQVRDEPVSEEQAWALCYQLCSLLSHRDGEWESVVFPAAGGILFSRDGSISLMNTNIGNNFLIDTEDQAVELVGRLVYSCLDWGLETQVERELSETLEILVCQMTKMNLSHTAHAFKSICTISDVIQVCEERLYDPSQAAQHYKDMCSILFLHTTELCHYLHTVQETRESLQKLILESETKLISRDVKCHVTTNWVSTWKDLVDELSRGVVLRPLTKTLIINAPLKLETPPFNQLLMDIQCRRYTLRKVQAAGNSQRRKDPHQTLLEFIRLRPKLRPASERNVGLKPKEEVCLHELLMQEIRSINHLKRLLSHNRTAAYKSDSSTNNEDTFLLNSTESGHGIRSNEALGLGNPHLREGRCTGVCTGKRRTRSFASNRDLFRVVKSSNKESVLTTIVDVMKMHGSHKGDQKNMSCELYRDFRVCSCCAMRSLFFTWHNICSLCSRVICPGCCVEMRLPSKWCVNLPLSFFKQIVMKDGEQSQRNFWNERWSWDSAWIPLVLVSSAPSLTSVHSLAMRDWYSQDICVSCQKFLLETCDSVLSSSPISDSQEI